MVLEVLERVVPYLPCLELIRLSMACSRTAALEAEGKTVTE